MRNDYVCKKNYINVNAINFRSLFTSLAVFLAMPFCFSASPQKEAKVKISVKNFGDRSLTYSRSYSGVFYLDHKLLELDEDSTATLIMPTDDIEYLNINASDPSGKQPNIHRIIWLQPGITTVSINPDDEQPVEVKSASGVIDKGSLPSALSKLGNNLFALYTLDSKKDELNLISDSVPSVVIRKIDNYIDSVCRKYKKESKVDLDIFKSNAGLYKYLIFSALFNKHKNEVEWKEAMNKLIGKTDFSSPYLGLFPYVQLVAGDIFYKKGGDEVKSLSGDDVLLASVDFYDTEFKGKMAEAAFATLLIDDGKRGQYNLAALELTERFKEKYPSSQIIPLLEEQVENNKVFNNPPEREGVVFRDNSAIETIADIIAPYKGKPVLIDLWATWCRPCLESFTRVEPLQKYAADNNLQLLYISIDEEPGIERKWKNIALKNNLTGDHVLMNQAVKDEIYSTFGSNGNMFIPCYVFVTPDGTIKCLDGSLAESRDFAVVKAELDRQLGK